MTPPRLRGMVDGLERCVKMEIYAKPEDKQRRKHETLQAKMRILKAFATLSAQGDKP